MAIKSGYVTIIGKPNVGKSTMLNALLGERLSIITNKPQTTRKPVMGILSKEDYQIIFLDTPGILKPEYLLQERMLDFILNSVNDADILLFIVDINNDPEAGRTLGDPVVIKILSNLKMKKIMLLNKVDISSEANVTRLMAKLEETKLFDKVFPVSALLNFNIDNVLFNIIDLLPEHPKYFPDDRLTNETERFFVSEIIREKILEQYQEEIPYSTEVVIEEFLEREGRKDFVHAAIIVERESQKPIIIGKNGAAIKELGQASRESIEAFLQRDVYLELRVKVREKWRSDPKYLKSFGYNTSNEE